MRACRLWQVFAQAFIPRRLEEVEDHERDFARLEAAQGAGCDGIYYQVITGMKADMSGARLHPSICEQVPRGAGVPLPGSEEGSDSPRTAPDDASGSDDGAAPDGEVAVPAAGEVEQRGASVSRWDIAACHREASFGSRRYGC